MDQTQHELKVQLTAEIVAAYVGHNSLRTSELPELITSIHAALAGLDQPAPEPEASKPVPAVSVKKSITPDHLISLEDGKGYKSLKRHLSGRGMTPADYRAKWGLPADYPMVAANYAAQRSELAKSIGLGRKRSEQVEAAEDSSDQASDPAPDANPAPDVDAAPEPKRRGRKKAS